MCLEAPPASTVTLPRSQDSQERIFGSQQDPRHARVVLEAANGKRPLRATPLYPAPAPLPAELWYCQGHRVPLGDCRLPGHMHGHEVPAGHGGGIARKSSECGSCSRNKWKRLYIYTVLLNTTPAGPWRALNCPSKRPTPTRVQPRCGTDRFWHRDKKLEAAILPPASSALCGGQRWGVARCTPAVVRMK